MVSEEKMKNRAILKRLQMIVHMRGEDEVPQVLERLKAEIAEIEGKPEEEESGSRRKRLGRDRKERGGYDREE